MLVFWLLSIVVAAGFVFLFWQFQSRLVGAARMTLLIASAIAVAIPLAIFTVVVVSYIFRVVLLTLNNPARYGDMNNLFLVGFLVSMGLLILNSRFVTNPDHKRYLTLVNVLVFVVALGILSVTLVQASQQFLRTKAVESIQTVTIRDLGVSGIGTAPAIIALTLYSLLPLVRNTYAGLNNVDPAIIDSGRGMGMTPWQIFFRIELPLAFPVIMAGVRNAAIALVGIGAVASVIGAGALGDFILKGINNTSIDSILLGAIPAVLLAFILDATLRLIEALLTSPGLRHV